MLQTFERGDGSTLVLLHGVAPPESLHGLAEQLADDFRAVVPALPGYGGSEQISPRAADDVLEALVEFIEGLDAEQVSLVGHSGGAYWALGLATMLPDMIERIALLAPAHYITPELKAELPQLAEAARAGQMPYEAVVPLWFREDFAQANPERIAALAKPYERDIAALADDLDSLASARDLRACFDEIEQPVYVRSGTDDVRALPEVVGELEELLTDVRIDWAQGGAHMVHIEDAEATVDALRAFFGTSK